MMTIDDSNRQLLRIANLGVEAEVWWQSEVGRHIEKSLEEDINANLEMLKVAEGDDVVKIQNIIRELEYLPRRINDLILAGNEAIQILDDQEN